MLKKPYRRSVVTRSAPWQITVFLMLLAALVLATADILVVTINLMLLVFAGLLFGVFTHALSDWLHRNTPLSYRVSFVIVVLGMIALFGGGLYFLGANVASRADEFWTQFRSGIQTGLTRLEETPWAKNYVPSLKEVQDSVSSSGHSILPKMWSGVQSLGWAVTAAFVICFVGWYAAYDPSLYRVGLVKLFPKRRRPKIRECLNKIRQALGRWIVGRMLSMSLVGIVTAIGLWMFGVPLPITFGGHGGAADIHSQYRPAVGGGAASVARPQR